MKFYSTLCDGESMRVVFYKQKPTSWVKNKMKKYGLAQNMEQRNEWFGNEIDKDTQKAVKKLLRGWQYRVTHPQESYEQRGTLCWSCDRAFGGCNWSRYFLPVDGWVACEVNRARKFNGKTQHLHSYHVYSCPLFVSDQNVTKNE